MSQGLGEGAPAVEGLRRRIAELEVENARLHAREAHVAGLRYKALIDATSLGVWSWNPKTGEGESDEVQAWWERVTGQSPEDQAVDGWLSFVHPEDAPKVTLEWNRALQSGTRFEAEYRLRTRGNETLHVLSIATPVLGPSGEVEEWIGSLQDVTPYRRALQGLMEAQASLQAIVQASPLAILALDRDGVVHLWNPAAERIFGWTAEEVIGKPLPAIPEERMEEFRKNIAATLRGKPLPSSVTKRRRKDGALIDVALWSAPLRLGPGEPTSILSLVEDISEKRRREHELASSRLSLELAMRGARMGYWSRDLATGEVFWSPELEELFGLDPGDFVGTERDFFRYVHKDDVPVLADAVQESIRTGKEYSVEFRFFRKDGSMGWMDGRGRATLDEKGVAQRLDGLGIDITERKEAAAAMFESERRFRFLAETMPVIAWSLTADGTMDFINQRYHEYSGVDGTYSPAQAWGALVHPEDKPAAFESYRRCVSEQRTWTHELRLRRKDGSYRWHLSRLEPVRDEYGTILRWFGTSTDIHDQKEAEAELERRVAERTRELSEANRELEGFTYSVSHDLRGPLRAISSTSMILLEEAQGKLSREEQTLLERQVHNANRLATLIDELLHLSRIGRQELSRTQLDLTEMAREVLQELSTSYPDAEVEIEPNIVVVGDAQLIRFVLLNLLENALKFSPGAAHVHVGQQEGAVFVRDRGIGFDMLYADKVFQPFERLVGEGAFPGTGIGLANAQRIIQRHGGRIWAESEPGKGSTFFFTLP